MKAKIIKGDELLLSTQDRRRCCMKTCDSTSSGLYNNRVTNRCSKPATVLVDDVAFCTLHAGKIALGFILNKE